MAERVAAILSRPIPAKKPIDSWLQLAGIVVALVYWLLPDKTPTMTLLALGLIFLCMIHPVWNFWWIDRSRRRRVGAVVALTLSISIFGYIVWPVYPTCVAYVDDAIGSGYGPNDLFPVGRNLAMNVTYANICANPIDVWGALGRIYIESGHDLREQQAVVAKFKDFIGSARKPELPTTLPKDSRQWISALGDHITDETRRAITNGSQTLFLVAEVAFKNHGERRFPMCRWLQPLSTSDKLTWHTCEVFNNVE